MFTPAPDNASTKMMTLRVVVDVDAKRLYLIAVAMEIGLDEAAPVRKFFDSFRLIPNLAIARVAETKWVEFKPEGAGFSVKLPGQPEQQKNTGVDGRPNEGRIYWLYKGKIVYQIAYGPSAPDLEKIAPDKMLDAVRDQWLKAMDLQIASKKMVRVDGHEAVEVLAGSKPQSVWRGKNVVLRMVLDRPGKKLYIFAAVGTPGFEVDPELRTYLDSIHLTDPAH